MCWKYEDQYPGGCTDPMFWRKGAEVLEGLEDWVGAEIDLEKARPIVEDMMTKLHEAGIMKPKEENGIS